MTEQRTFIDELKHQYQYGGMTIKLIMLNTAVFLFINLLVVIARLLGGDLQLFLDELLKWIFTLNTDLSNFILSPWGLITSIFAHYSIWHLVFNMIFLYFIGRMFEQFFDQKRLFYTYLLAGLAGGILEILAHFIFPVFQSESSVVVGASGSVMGIFMAMAFYQPQAKVHLFGMFPVRMIWLAVAFLLLDFLNLGRNDGTAHFAHIGGAIIGILSIQNINSSSNIINRLQLLGDRTQRMFSRADNKRTKMRVDKTEKNARFKTDVEYNVEVKTRQEEVDRILDKISKSGYDSLTKKEKEFLFNQSKNG
jgi:membrane associated rhomboid family serine protease